MATTIFCKDGTVEVLHELSVERLRQLVEDHIGLDAVDYMDDIRRDHERVKSLGENWERISDGYYNMLTSTAQELESVLAMFKKRLNRDELYRRLLNIYNNIEKNT